MSENGRFIFCSRCGTKINEGTNFCPNCGMEIPAQYQNAWQNGPHPGNGQQAGNAAQYGQGSNQYGGNQYGGNNGGNGNNFPVIAIVLAIVGVLVMAIICFIAVRTFLSKKENNVAENEISTAISTEAVISEESSEIEETVEIETSSTEFAEKDNEASSTEEIADAAPADLPTEDDIRGCLDRFIDWSGLQMIEIGEPVSGLNESIAIPIAVCYTGHDYDKYQYTEDGTALMIPIEDVNETMEKLFGKKYDLDGYDESNYMTMRLDENYFGMTMGDWGESYPKYDITSVKEEADGSFTVEVEYYEWSDVDQMRINGSQMNMIYSCKADASKPYGFYITDMKTEGSSNSSGEVEISESSEDGYSDAELIKMAEAYYTRKNGVKPPSVAIDSSDGNMVLIHLYENVTNEDEAHTATWDWYNVDRTTGKGEDILGNSIDITE